MFSDKVVAALNVKNEEIFIGDILTALSEFVDEIVIVDDGSTDDTVRICKSFEKVVDIVCKEEGIRTEIKDWNLLIKMATKRNANWILFTDADEFFEPKIKDKLPKLIANDSVGVYHFRKLTVWRDPYHFRMDRPEKFIPFGSMLTNPLLVRNSPKLRWMHQLPLKRRIYNWLRYPILKRRPQFHRGKLNGIYGSAVYINDLIVLHYSVVDYWHSVEKQMRYMLWMEEMQPHLGPDELVSMTMEMIDERGLQLAEIRPEWRWPFQDPEKYILSSVNSYRRTKYWEKEGKLQHIRNEALKGICDEDN